MNQLTSSPENHNLSYQFFFLMRTHWWENEHRIEEPFLGSDRIKVNTQGKGVKIDNDKRLFRYDVKENISLDEWQIYLKEAWGLIQETYHKNDEHQSKEFPQKLLLGVSLVVLDESLQHHQIKVNVKSDHKTQENYFQLCGDSLLQLVDNNHKMPLPANFYAFELNQHKNDNWVLQFGEQNDIPYLEKRTPQTNITFLVLGLAHGDALADINNNKEWAFQLSAMLLGDDQSTPHNKLEILNVIVA